MARLAKSIVIQREQEVMDAFVKGASVKEANEALSLKHGTRMGLKRIYELRDAVRAALASTPEAVPAVDAEVVAA
jgi:hypothetical protein